MTTCNDKARAYFHDEGLDYSVLSYETLEELLKLVEISLENHNDSSAELKMKAAKRWKIKTDEDSGDIKAAYLTVDGPYFKNREAISFDDGGWIGFAGWASSENTKPFTQAFMRWVAWLMVRGWGEP